MRRETWKANDPAVPTTKTPKQPVPVMAERHTAASLERERKRRVEQAVAALGRGIADAELALTQAGEWSGARPGVASDLRALQRHVETLTKEAR
jgi:hypothetical protein